MKIEDELREYADDDEGEVYEMCRRAADALAALRAENGRLRDNLASKTAERDVALGALAEQEERAERAESQLAAAQAVLAAAHDALTEIALAGMSLPMVCGDDEETKNRFHARRAWEFIGIAARAKTEIDAARAERDAADRKAEQWADECDRANHALAAAQSVIAAADTQLSRVLHEMAGAVSLCWEPKPTGVFNSTQACEFVAAAIAELRAILHSDAARAGGGK